MHEGSVGLELLRPRRSFVQPRHLPNLETGRRPSHSPLSDDCGCLIKIDDALHERIMPDSGGPCAPLGTGAVRRCLERRLNPEPGEGGPGLGVWGLPVSAYSKVTSEQE